MAVGRRRPGQRAVASKAVGRSVYDVELDKQIRARAKFEQLSLGQAASRYGGRCRVCVPVVRSYIAKEEHPTILNEELSNEELEIILSLKDYELNRSTPLKLANPVLFMKVEQMVRTIAEERLAKARRARHTPHVLAYAKYLENLPRYQTFVLSGELAESIPY
jgi:hypothetical protein